MSVYLFEAATRIATHSQPREVLRQIIPRCGQYVRNDTMVYCDKETFRNVLMVAWVIAQLAEMLYRCPAVQSHTFEGYR